jgi:hypothetical protein
LPPCKLNAYVWGILPVFAKIVVGSYFGKGIVYQVDYRQLLEFFLNLLHVLWGVGEICK